MLNILPLIGPMSRASRTKSKRKLEIASPVGTLTAMAHATREKHQRYQTIWRIVRKPMPEPVGCGLLLDLCEDDLPRVRDARLADRERRLAADLLALVDRLHTRHQLAIRMRFWDGYTLEQTGAVLEVSKERCRQILNRAIRELYELAHDHWWPGEKQG